MFMRTEERVMKKISRILSKLEPEAAASVARQVASSYGVAVVSEEPDDLDPPELEPRPPADDSPKPSFMHTQHRMTIGKEILERERGSKQ